MSNDYLSVPQAAALLGVSTARVRQLREAGEFPGAIEPLGPGRGWLLPRAEVVSRRDKKSSDSLPKGGWPKGKPWSRKRLRAAKKSSEIRK